MTRSISNGQSEYKMPIFGTLSLLIALAPSLIKLKEKHWGLAHSPKLKFFASTFEEWKVSRVTVGSRMLSKPPKTF